MSNLEAMQFIPEMEDKPQHECGFIGVVAKDAATVLARIGIATMQNRGQDSAGMTVMNGEMKSIHGFGLINTALTPDIVNGAGSSDMAIAHTRYSITGSINRANIQPIHDELNVLDGNRLILPSSFQLEEPTYDTLDSYPLSLAHNGNLTNGDWFSERVETELPEDASDTVVLTRYLLEQRYKYDSWAETLRSELAHAKGGYSAIALTQEGMHGFRDPWGIRPYAFGRFKDGGAIFASETIALRKTNAEYARDLKHGEIITVTPDGELYSSFFGEPKRARPCMIEKIYFSRPSDFADDMFVQEGRQESGRMLADRAASKGIEYSHVVPIHSSGYHAARGAAEQSGKPLLDAVESDHFVGRSYTLPEQHQREVAVSMKHTVIPIGLDGASVFSVDDSTVRATTSRNINEELYNEGGADEVHQGAASSPVVFSCDMGVDTKGPLPASEVADKPLEEIELFMAPKAKATTMTYLPREDNARAFGKEEKDVCNYCMGGEHPIHGKQEQFPQKERLIEGKPKLSVFVSGNGTNLQKIIDGTQLGLIDADINFVLSNNPDAFGLRRAEEAEIPTVVVSSKGMLRDPIKRAEYNAALIDAVRNNPPDAVVLAGLMTILGDEFLEAMQDLEIPVINLHPGLPPTRSDSNKVATSRGLMEVFRGTEAIQKAYDQKVRASGVTVHQLLPGNEFDTGPIILKQEVHRRVDDTPDIWEQRMHEAEYQTLPTAINRVLHVVKHGIDVSKGDFPW